MVKVGINGFGRIGRLVLKYSLDEPDIRVVAINDITSPDVLAHLFKYDSVHGRYEGVVSSTEESIIINNNEEIKVFSEKTPDAIPWDKVGVDIVVESTGRFRKFEQAELHLKRGVKKVIISAPAKGETPVPTVVIGVNEGIIKPEDKVISNASCTTNCFAPLIDVIDKKFKVKYIHMTTIHSYTNDQRILDSPHSDLRRARAAAVSMIPTTTGAAKAIQKIFPSLKGKVSAISVRVPTPDVSIVDMVCEVEKETNEKEVNQAFKEASENYLKGILEYSEEELVSVDLIGNTHSAIVDGKMTKVIGNLVKVFAWYDNESGYSKRIVDLIKYISKL